MVGASENYGTEQEHLNNVFGAHLRITSLRAADGPGVEFLEYLTPRSGRVSPPDTQPDDLWYWQINLRTARASPEFVELHESRLGWVSGMLTHDPDGHANLLAVAAPQARN